MVSRGMLIEMAVYNFTVKPNFTGSMSQKLNQRLTSAPVAAVLISAWLKDRGISSRLADYYSRSGWLHRVGDGAFTARRETPTWMGAVYGLQQKPDSIHPGGRTSLEIFGHAHFIPLGANYPIYRHDVLSGYRCGEQGSECT